MALLANKTQTIINDGYQYYLWTLTLAGKIERIESEFFPIMTIPSFVVTDKRSKGWFLVDSPLPTLLLTCTYLGMVFAGPKFMRKWVNIKPV